MAGQRVEAPAVRMLAHVGPRPVELRRHGPGSPAGPHSERRFYARCGKSVNFPAHPPCGRTIVRAGKNSAERSLVSRGPASLYSSAAGGRSGRLVSFLHPARASVHGPAQHRDHRARRPRQDHPGRPAAAAVRHLPREPAGSGTGDGQQRPRARARDHHPGQVHLGGLEGRADQHRRHARPRRFRRRGRAHPVDGRQLPAPGRRGRGADAADQVRARQGAAQGTAADRRDQQGRQARAALDRGPERDLRPVRRPRRRRAPARLPAHLRQRQAGLGGARARRPRARTWPRCST